jgi:signal transduction histidine kinase
LPRKRPWMCHRLWVANERSAVAVVFDHRRLVLTARGVLLVLCTGLTAADYSGGAALRVTALLAVALLASLPVRQAGLARAQPYFEAGASTAVILAGDGPHEQLLPYLLVPGLHAGLAFGAVASVSTVGISALVMIVGRLVGPLTSRDLVEFSRMAAEWLLLALAAGMLGSWVRRISSQSRSPTNESYAAAYRLISQLRTVSRQLSSGLDAVSIGQSLLQSLRAKVLFDRGAVYTRTQGGRLVPLAFEGCARVDWDASMSGGSLFGEAWSTQQPMARSTGFGGEQGVWSAAIPLRIGLRTFGVVAIERQDDGAVTPEDLHDCMSIIDEAALRLETALLFADVRSIATAEERRRLAREIHDGIAQELASLGYVIDELRARSRGGDLERPLRDLRTEVTRIISELRLSIFDLRSEVQPNAGLGAALSDYTRSIGAASPMRVHLELDEGPQRLSSESEAELLRIAQESMTNARKHASATNLWVACHVDPPYALLRVEDDGRGLGSRRADSFGLEIMRERAGRIGGRLIVGDRPAGGTFVEVVVGSPRTEDADSRNPIRRDASVHDRAAG